MVPSPAVDEGFTLVGDFVVAVNGVELEAPDDSFPLLDGTVSRQTVIAGGPVPTADTATFVDGDREGT